MNDDLYIGDIATRLSLEKDKANIQHIQKLDDVGEQVKDERTYGDNGFTDQRTMRKLGSIPSIFLHKPEYKDIIDGDQKAMSKAARRFFEDHPEFRTCNQNF
jgi:hypothetical protein|tara:strand:+ start:4519 stop:4824 length:306 start_codon:yes stop_codon:yes gene_type:complete